MAWRHSLKVGLRHTDAAGVLFFAEQLALVHDAYEAMLAEHGLPLGQFLRDGHFGVPIVHAETDLLRPLFVDDVLTVELHAERVGTTSYTLRHIITRGEELVGRGKTVHVCIDARGTGGKRPLAEPLKQVLAALGGPPPAGDVGSA